MPGSAAATGASAYEATTVLHARTGRPAYYVPCTGDWPSMHRLWPPPRRLPQRARFRHRHPAAETGYTGQAGQVFTWSAVLRAMHCHALALHGWFVCPCGGPAARACPLRPGNDTASLPLRWCIGRTGPQLPPERSRHTARRRRIVIIAISNSTKQNLRLLELTNAKFDSSRLLLRW